MSWRVEYLDEDVKAALDAMPEDIRASFRRIVEMVGSYGLVGLTGFGGRFAGLRATSRS